jgi:formylglycine-generating enzyme required for sulfatase activity
VPTDWKENADGSCTDNCSVNNGGCDASATCTDDPSSKTRVSCTFHAGDVGSGTSCTRNLAAPMTTSVAPAVATTPNGALFFATDRENPIYSSRVVLGQGRAGLVRGRRRRTHRRAAGRASRGPSASRSGAERRKDDGSRDARCSKLSRVRSGRARGSLHSLVFAVLAAQAALAPACARERPPRPDTPRAASSSSASVTGDAAIALAVAVTDAAAAPAPAAPFDASTDSAPPRVDATADMLGVPGGTFTMGADHGGQEDERPAHAVTLRAFLLDRTEVTNEAYAACVAAGPCRPHDMHIASITHSGDDAGFNRPHQPVVGVAWQDARDYCAWRGKRLPREAELERAIRGDDGRRFPWGDEAPTRERTAFGRPLGKSTTDDVGSHPAGRGPYGHDDLAGNVWEWMDDLYDPYAYRRATAADGRPGTCDEIRATQDELRAQGKQGFTGSNPIPVECERSIRGGAFNYDGPGLRSTNRVHHPAGYRLVMLGIRCARDAD